MCRGIVLVVIHAEHDGDVLVGRRGGDDDLLDGGSEVRLCLGRIGEEAGRFDDDFGADGGPVELCGVALCEDLDLLTVDRDEVVAGGDLVLQIAEDRVVLQQVGQCGGGSQIVNGDEFDVGIADCRAEDVAADAAKAVDTNFYCHDVLAPQGLRADCVADVGNVRSPKSTWRLPNGGEPRKLQGTVTCSLRSDRFADPLVAVLQAL